MSVLAPSGISWLRGRPGAGMCLSSPLAVAAAAAPVKSTPGPESGYFVYCPGLLFLFSQMGKMGNENSLSPTRGSLRGQHVS